MPYRGFDPIQIPMQPMRGGAPLYNWMADYTPYQRGNRTATDRAGERVIGAPWPWEQDAEMEARNRGALNEAAMAAGVNMGPNAPPSNFLIPANPTPYRGFGPIETPRLPGDPGQDMFGLPTSPMGGRGPGDGGGTGGGEGGGTGTGTGTGTGSGTGTGTGTGTGSGTGSGTGAGDDDFWSEEPGSGGGTTGGTGTGSGTVGGGTGAGTGTGTVGTGTGATPSADANQNGYEWDDVWAAMYPNFHIPAGETTPPDMPRGYPDWRTAIGAYDWELAHGGDPNDPSPENPYGQPDVIRYPGASGDQFPQPSGGGATSGGATGGAAGGGTTGGGGGGGGGQPTPPLTIPGFGGNIGNGETVWTPTIPPYVNPTVRPTQGISGTDILGGATGAFGGIGGSGGGLVPGGPILGGGLGGVGDVLGGVGAIGQIASLFDGDVDMGTKFINAMALMFGPTAYLGALPAYLGGKIDDIRVDSGERADAGNYQFHEVGKALLGAIGTQPAFTSSPTGSTASNSTGQFFIDFAKSVHPDADPFTGTAMNSFYREQPAELLTKMIEFYNANPGKYYLDPTATGVLSYAPGSRGPLARQNLD